MDQKMLFKQMIDFQKATFDNSFSAMSTLQEQGEKMVTMFLDQAPWLPQEGRKAITDWVEAYKRGRDTFKETVETNFSKVQEFFESKEKTPAE
jgi:hypothetical protein